MCCKSGGPSLRWKGALEADQGPESPGGRMKSQATQILLIEDEAIVALSLTKDLERMGYGVSGTANCVADAILLAQEHKPDLVLMDIELKDDDLDGIDAARCLKALYDVPVIFVSGQSDPDTIRRASEASPVGFLTKPLRMNELEVNLEIALAGTRVERAVASMSMIQLLCDEVFVWDLDRDWMRYAQKWNPGVPRTAEPAGAFFFEQVHPEDRSEVRASLNYHLERRTPQFDMEYRTLRPDHRYVWSRFRGALLSSRGRGFNLLLGTHTDVNDRRIAEESLIQSSFQDPVVELGNRTFLLDRLHDIHMECRKNGTVFGALFFTLEGLREINETEGHRTGDAVLREITGRLRLEMRRGEVVARYSGAEFVAVIPGLPAERMEERALAILSVVKRPVRVEDRMYQLSTRSGLAVGPGIFSAEEILAKAEREWQRSLLKPQASIGHTADGAPSRAVG